MHNNKLNTVLFMSFLALSIKSSLAEDVTSNTFIFSGKHYDLVVKDGVKLSVNSFCNISGGGCTPETNQDDAGWGSTYNTVIENGGKMYSSGETYNTTIKGGGQLVISQKSSTDPEMNVGQPGMAKDTNIESGGLLYIKEMGQSVNTIIQDGGIEYVYDQGYAYDSTIKSGGKQWLYKVNDRDLGGVSFGTVIGSGGKQYVQDHGSTANGSIVNGTQYVYNSGLSAGAIINNGGLQLVYNGGVSNDTMINRGGELRVYDGGSANYSIVDGGYLSVSAGSMARDTTINNGGVVDVKDGGTLALNTTINAGGKLNINDDSTAENTSIEGNGASIYLSANAQSRGSMRASNGGAVYLQTKATGYGRIDNLDLNDSSANLFLMPDGDNGIATIGSLINNGNVVFGSMTRAGTFSAQTLEINDLSGNGRFVMRTDIAGQGNGANNYGDKLIIKNSTDGTHQVTVLNNGGAATNGTESLSLIETADGKGQFNLDNQVELGGYVYDLMKDGNNWLLTTGKFNPAAGPDISKPADASVNFLNTGYLVNYAENQTLSQRMGELRSNTSQSNLWVRAYNGKFDSFATGKLNDFSMNYSGFQLGADKQNDMAQASMYYGVVAGLTDANPKYASGDGSLKNYHLGIYGSYINDNGFYLDSIIKYNRLKNSFNVRDSQNALVNGKASGNGVSASVEAGKRMYFGQTRSGIYIEPQAQLTVGWQEGVQVNASNGLKVDLDSYTSVIGRAGTQLGYQVTNAKAPTNIYLKTGIVREFSGNADYSLNGSKENHSFKGNWWSNGVGVSTKINNKHNLFLDLEAQNGSQFNQSQVNLGYRLNF